jgi:glutamine---fructose-6-phosphate transaminase (isomerizing)
LMAKAGASGATIIGITSSADGPLAREAALPLLIPIQADHAISVNTYSALAAAAGALASAAVGSFNAELASSLSHAVAETARLIPFWQEQIASTAWLAPRSTYHFLARGSSLASCHEARLLWEEGAKWPATAMGTGGFRHGPQEMVTKHARFGMWIDGRRMRREDLAVARDLRQLGASVMLIGQDLPGDAGDLVFQLPTVSSEWQFLIDVIPAQLGAEHLARLSGVDCDSFRFCAYVVEDEYGLLHKEAGTPKDETGKATP